jgi:hypothetical protein
MLKQVTVGVGLFVGATICSLLVLRAVVRRMR